MINKARNFFLNIFFPKFCFLCKREGDYFCEDCKATLEISGIHQKEKTRYLSDLYFACDYKKPIIKRLIQNFKYEPFVKELSRPLSSLIMAHFQLADSGPNFKDFILIPVPLEKKRLKWRGFNQAEEIAKELSISMGIPLLKDCLFKTKETPPQMELTAEERKENLKEAFVVNNKYLIKNHEEIPLGFYAAGKKILLVDDVYTTGATMEECARVLKQTGAKEIQGIVIARGE